MFNFNKKINLNVQTNILSWTSVSRWLIDACYSLPILLYLIFNTSNCDVLLAFLLHKITNVCRLHIDFVAYIFFYNFIYFFT